MFFAHPFCLSAGNGALDLKRFELRVSSSQIGSGPYQWLPGFFPKEKRPELEVDHPSSSNAEVKNRGAISVFSLTSSWNRA
jgi:hypothetical protein